MPQRPEPGFKDWKEWFHKARAKRERLSAQIAALSAPDGSDALFGQRAWLLCLQEAACAEMQRYASEALYYLPEDKEAI